MAFHNVRLSTDISRGSTGGPERLTEIVRTRSGAEYRNAPGANSLRSYDAGYGIRTVRDIHDILSFWEARRGQLNSFRWKDWTDFKSCSPETQPTALDQNIGVGTGSRTVFQLQKSYGDAGGTYVRRITKPVLGTVLIARAGIAQSSGWTLDSASGTVTFAVAPLVGQVVTAGFEFDVEVRFDEAKLTLSIDALNHGSIPSIMLREVLS